MIIIPFSLTSIPSVFLRKNTILSLDKQKLSNMLEIVDEVFLRIHVWVGSLCLILFWIPVLVKKGGNTHRKVGQVYFWGMWVVVISALFLSIINGIEGHYESAIFLGYLTLITGYPLWYGYEILNQPKIWTSRYFQIRKWFSYLLFFASLAMIIGAIIIWNMYLSSLMVFFGLLGIGSIKDARMTKSQAMDVEKRMNMHIQGMVISGIAAHTAFLAFGGRRFLAELLPGMFQVLPWILPTIIGVIFIRKMKRKFSGL